MAHSSGGSRIPQVLAIVGIVILAIIILWGLIHLLTLSSGWLSSLFGGDKNAITVSVPAQVTSGTPFVLSWKHATSDRGSYAFLYQCKDGLTLYTPVAGQFSEVKCGGAYTLGAATSSATLLPVLTASTSVSDALTVVFISSATSTAAQPQGSATTIVVPQSTAQATTTKPTELPQKTNPVVQGPADLSVTILSSTVDAYGNATLVFDIANVGQGQSGVYYFTAQLPTQDGYSYTSPAQSPLAAGSHVVSTLNFTLAVPGSAVVSISGGNDVNSANNFATQFVNAPATSYQSNGPIYSPGVQPYYQPTVGTGQCYYNGATYVCNQPASYSNGLPYYINSGQYQYIPQY
ncbi:MAG TPA: hypothetical protein VHD38_01795 [Candidatus Paceibacterota bacterium]|nr:hypothetical protein [Candidatus Paceibacterota bacterium]